MIEFTISIEDHTDDWDDFKYIKDFLLKNNFELKYKFTRCRTIALGKKYDEIDIIIQITDTNTIDEIKKLIDFLQSEGLYEF